MPNSSGCPAASFRAMARSDFSDRPRSSDSAIYLVFGALRSHRLAWHRSCSFVTDLPTRRTRGSPMIQKEFSWEKEVPMLWTIFVILLVLWLVGIVSSYTMGGFIHILLVIALAVVLIQVLSGRRAV